ncbi:MarR family transcriptional regulator [Actinomadura violacea]|uniref:MarR family transcriptional regulator n=1 Tax=Actinomadura violacea TaxID=2819934 RepID=A0ABS3RUH8_9ACTN|nr:helix-turn-helix domain-containing protein [Actinomadura violacea]MBO2460378.1 MarR family transcriptional regulator [Actinomadura violacea]
MNGVELFLLGRTLMKIGEEAMPAPRGGPAGGTRAILIVLSDIVGHPGSAIGEIAERTGLPQSQVSTAVARLRKTGSVVAEPDPDDRRRSLVRKADEDSDRVAEVRSTTIDAALTAALDGSDHLAEVTDALAVLARHLGPESLTHLRTP